MEIVEDTVAIVVERVSGGWKKAFGFGGNGGGGRGDDSSAGKAERIGKNNAGTVQNNSRGKNMVSSLRSSNGQRSNRSKSTPTAKSWSSLKYRTRRHHRPHRRGSKRRQYWTRRRSTWPGWRTTITAMPSRIIRMTMIWVGI